MSWPSVRDRPDGCCQQTVSCGAAFMDVQALFNAMKGNSISYVISTNYIGFLQFDYESHYLLQQFQCVFVSFRDALIMLASCLTCKYHGGCLLQATMISGED